ncbi:hypothetical protein JCM6882_002983 [Rhodosporidiobolus microsporus]
MMCVSTSAPFHTLVLRGERFVLSETQLRTDSPNWFTGHFLSNDYPDVVYADRKPDILRKVVLEHLSGYEVFPVKGFIGLSEEEAARAVLAEAEYFKLKKLVAKAKEVVHEARRTLHWPFKGGPPNEFFRFNSVSELSLTAGASHEAVRAVLWPAAEEHRLYQLSQLQLRITNGSIEGPEPHAAAFGAIFLDPAIKKLIKAVRGVELLPVEYWEGATHQASVAIDGLQVSLEVLLQWAANPSPSLSKIRALQPLTDLFHPELIPQNRRLLTLYVKSAVGYFASGSLRLVHLNIRSCDQGYSHLDKPCFCLVSPPL